MRRLFILLAVLSLAGCEPKKITYIEPGVPVEEIQGLPRASQMQTEGKIMAPQQAVEFCNNHQDDFEEKCP